MGMLNWLTDLFSNDLIDESTNTNFFDDEGINPATGLPMTGGVDVAGNPFGTDLSSDNDLNSSMDDSFSSGIDSSTSSMDDSFSSGIDDSTSNMDDSFSSGFDDW